MAAAYSWASAALLLILTFDIFHDPWIAPVLVALSLALFEIGRFFKKGFLRWQGYVLVAAAVRRYILTTNCPFPSSDCRVKWSREDSPSSTPHSLRCSS